MISANRFRLLFFLVHRQKAIFRATGWQIRDFSEDMKLSAPRRTYERGYRADIPDADIDAADLHLKLIQALDETSCDLKVADIVSRDTSDEPVTKRTLPLSLSEDDIKSWARRQKMNRVEAVLISLGFLLRDDLKEAFESFVFERRRHGTFTKNLEHFPLIEAFLERDAALGSSEVFKNAHMIHRHQTASTLDIFEWFNRMDYSLPDGLISAVQKYHRPNTETDSKQDARLTNNDIDSANPKTLASLYTMIHAMAAMKPYSFEPGSTAAQSKIETAILDAGLNMSPKTIRKHLDEAALAVQEIKEKNQ